MPSWKRRRSTRQLVAWLAAVSMFVLINAGAGSAGAAPADPSAPAAGLTDLKTDLDKILGDPRLATAQAGVVVTDAAGGEVLYSRDETGVLLPASNEKLLTSAAAFEILGPDHRFTTTALVDKPVDKRGTVDGNLYLRGTGDPTALAAGYDELAAKVAAAGVKVVRGNLVADDTWFDSQRLGPFWSWDDEPFYYSAQISALTASPDSDLDAGSVIVNVAPGAADGAAAKVTLTPPTGHVKIVNRAVTGGQNSISVDREHGTNNMVVTGSIPAGATPVQEWMAVWEPTGYAADLFRRALKAHGVTVARPTTTGATPGGATEVAARQSPPLSQVAVPFMKLSNNPIAEILVKSMGRKVSGRGTWSAGVAAINTFLAANGVSGLRMTDGSGLSRADLVSPRSLATLLSRMRSKPWFSTWYEALPIAGNPDRLVGGTLRSRMRGTPAAGNVHAKTGSLTSVSALSGYVTSADGEPLIFSIMMNNHLSGAPTDLQDAIAVRLAQFTRSAATDGAPSPLRLRIPTPRARPGGPDPGAVECSWVKAC